ncbi:hypothetical protein Tcan_01959 [Toxocara canis]|uniref:Uncharacterized protein n=1 Tax=Toxocara canis TaxID=6265 RepID=A0A0B2W4E4_TOXCA|nr:hypothetical protein Tcan_01959 [Toxocara canis]
MHSDQKAFISELLYECLPKEEKPRKKMQRSYPTSRYRGVLCRGKRDVKWIRLTNMRSVNGYSAIQGRGIREMDQKRMICEVATPQMSMRSLPLLSLYENIKQLAFEPLRCNDDNLKDTTHILKRLREALPERFYPPSEKSLLRIEPRRTKTRKPQLKSWPDSQLLQNDNALGK